MVSQEKWGRQQTKWYMQKVPFYDKDYVYQQQGGICRRYLLLQGLCVPSVKTKTYVCNRFNTYFHTKNHKRHQAISFYTLLHQATRGEVKNSLRDRRDIFVSDHFSLLHYVNFNL